jgi:hypothetical protein
MSNLGQHELKILGNEMNLNLSSPSQIFQLYEVTEPDKPCLSTGP